MEIENEEELSTSDALEAAWDQSEESVLEEVEDDGLEQGQAGEAGEAEEAGEVDQTSVQENEAAEATEAEASDKPPVSLSAAAREAWKDTPPAMRAEIAKRERDFAQGIQKYAEDSKRVQAMDNSLKPYQQLFAMNGGAGQFMPSLLNTASILQMGAPAQKAQTVANLIQQFGVDIATLDNVLTGQPQTQEQPQTQQLDINQLVDQRFQQYQQREAQAQQQIQGQAAMATIQAFGNNPANEFYNDVKMEMADIIELASNRGQAMTLQQAYDKACILNPEISAIVNGRISQSSVTRKLRAASSVGGGPGGEGGSSAPGSMRSVIEEAWGEQGQV